MSRQAFGARFSDEEACSLYLAEHRWPEGFVCPSFDKHRSQLGSKINDVTKLSDIADGSLYLEYNCECYAQPTVREVQEKTNWVTTDDVEAHAVCGDHKERVKHLPGSFGCSRGTDSMTRQRKTVSWRYGAFLNFRMIHR